MPKRRKRKAGVCKSVLLQTVTFQVFIHVLYMFWQDLSRGIWIFGEVFLGFLRNRGVLKSTLFRMEEGFDYILKYDLQLIKKGKIMNSIKDLSMFLYGVLDLIKDGKQENCSVLAERANNGIATYLVKENKSFFERNGLRPDKIHEADEFYRNYATEFDRADSVYACDENDGLFLLIKLALN